MTAVVRPRFASRGLLGIPGTTVLAIALVSFEPDGGTDGSGGCNGYGGLYEITGSQLAIGEVEMTFVECDDKIAAAEGNFFAALRRSNGISLVGDELALSGPSTELIFRQAEE